MIEIKTYRFNNTFKALLGEYYTGRLSVNENNNYLRKDINGFLMENTYLEQDFNDSENIILLDLILPNEYVELN